MSRYVYYQPNEKDIKDEYGDCAIRALTKAMGMSWIEVFDELCRYARYYQCLPNQKPATHSFMEDSGWHYTSIPKGKRITVEDFAKSHKGEYNLHVRVGYNTHFVAVVDGKYYDTWDSGKKLLYGYWSKKEDV